MNDDGYRVRRLTPTDAPGVRAVVQRVYGSAYFHDEVYEPEKLLRMNESGHLISAVVVDATDHVVGHYALERPDLGLVPETGEGMILPEHRGHQLFSRLRAFLEDEARQRGFIGLWGTPTTAHVRSQKVYQEFHCHPTGICLGALIAFCSDLTGPEGKQRLSMLTYFKYLRPPPPARCYLPVRHQQLVQQIYERLGRSVHFVSDEPTTAAAGQATSDFRGSDRTGNIHVQHIGRDSLAQLKQELCLQRDRAAEAIFLQLPLEQPGAVALCLAAEAEGFFFTGIRPRSAEQGDLLQMQCLTAPFDMGLLHIDEAFAREIVAHVAAERQRTAP